MLPSPFRTLCIPEKSDMISQLELGKPERMRKPEKRVNGIFWIILLNIGIFVADHFFQDETLGQEHGVQNHVSQVDSDIVS
ncbi:Rhomboid-like protein 11, chloroplastic [Stylosanthes scabra]|uniref:Rhomboid-like protein 11, chloroplastic n=1 Tax=Stylosanthes scabra TaxID=79078 RepID=A0ABU6T8I6_9FABA|nr:Rhomboid-like protein 11, chloroplastic [Stylosanthes scabra]